DSTAATNTARIERIVDGIKFIDALNESSTRVDTARRTIVHLVRLRGCVNRSTRTESGGIFSTYKPSCSTMPWIQPSPFYTGQCLAFNHPATVPHHLRAEWAWSQNELFKKFAPFEELMKTSDELYIMAEGIVQEVWGEGHVAMVNWNEDMTVGGVEIIDIPTSLSRQSS
ncbi:MAG: hypothetical protein Q9162_007570, partial [Coniocarpon cinnabarinum]